MTKTTRSKSAKESEAAASTRCEQKARQTKDKINWRKECKHPYVCDNEETCTLPREGNIAIYYPNADPNGPDGWHQHDYTARIINIHVINGIRPSDGGYCDVKYRYSIYNNIPYRGKGVNPCGVFHPSDTDASNGYWSHLMTTATNQENDEGISHEWAHGNYNDDNVWQSYTGQWRNVGRTASQPRWRRIDKATSKAEADQKLRQHPRMVCGSVGQNN